MSGYLTGLPMKITSMSTQVRNPNRVNISVDGKYRFSLDISQVTSLGIKTNLDYSEAAIAEFEQEGEFGKIYSRALEYCFVRPRSSREMRDYLWRKTLAKKYKTRQGEVRDREGVPQAIVDRVFDRLVEKGHIDDERFAEYWIENRKLRQGVSRRHLSGELRQKGVASGIIDQVLSQSSRDESDELSKIIAKKARLYSDRQKFIQYLARQGFSYDDIKSALEAED
ncbi:MAG: RecX family transcriptional regulator [bacterium]|nr:RecX family transcriptional regulator [bacterium]